MKYFSKKLSPFMLWALAPALPQLESHFERFQQLSVDAVVEDNLSREIRISESRPLLPDKSAMAALPSELKVEWALRLGSKAAGLSFRDVIYIARPEVLDEALWLLFSEQVGKTYFTDLDSWRSALSNFSKLLRRPELNSALFDQAHGAWWLWMKNSKLPKNATAELRAVNAYLEALLQKDAVKRVAGLLGAYDLWMQTLLADLQDSVLRRRMYEEIYSKKILPPKKGWQTADLDKFCEARALACQALSDELHAQFQVSESLRWWEVSKPTAFQERLKLADLYLENQRFKRAREVYEELGKSDFVKAANDRSLNTKIEVSAFAAKMREAFGQKNFIDLADAFDQEGDALLKTHFSSVWRDLLLELRADNAKATKRTDLAINRSLFRFQYALTRNERLEGLKSAIQLRVERNARAYSDVKSLVAELSLLKRLEPDTAKLGDWIGRAKLAVQKLPADAAKEAVSLKTEIDGLEKGHL